MEKKLEQPVSGSNQQNNRNETKGPSHCSGSATLILEQLGSTSDGAVKINVAGFNLKVEIRSARGHLASFVRNGTQTNYSWTITVKGEGRIIAKSDPWSPSGEPFRPVHCRFENMAIISLTQIEENKFFIEWRPLNEVVKSQQLVRIGSTFNLSLRDRFAVCLLENSEIFVQLDEHPEPLSEIRLVRVSSTFAHAVNLEPGVVYEMNDYLVARDYGQQDGSVPVFIASSFRSKVLGPSVSELSDAIPSIVSTAVLQLISNYVSTAVRIPANEPFSLLPGQSAVLPTSDKDVQRSESIFETKSSSFKPFHQTTTPESKINKKEQKLQVENTQSGTLTLFRAQGRASKRGGRLFSRTVMDIVFVETPDLSLRLHVLPTEIPAEFKEENRQQPYTEFVFHQSFLHGDQLCKLSYLPSSPSFINRRYVLQCQSAVVQLNTPFELRLGETRLLSLPKDAAPDPWLKIVHVGLNRYSRYAFALSTTIHHYKTKCVIFPRRRANKRPDHRFFYVDELDYERFWRVKMVPSRDISGSKQTAGKLAFKMLERLPDGMRMLATFVQKDVYNSLLDDPRPEFKNVCEVKPELRRELALALFGPHKFCTHDRVSKRIKGPILNIVFGYLQE